MQQDKGPLNSSTSFEQPLVNKTIIIPAEPPTNPLDLLLHRVNGQGRYQWISFIIFSLQWFIVAWLLLGGAFYFETASFQCNGVKSKECTEQVCKLPASQWIKYIPSPPKSIPYAFQTIYMCEYGYIVTILQSLVYLGSLLGFFVIPYIADNWGRKRAIVISWVLCTLGVILLATAQQTSMVAIGQFLAGFGGNPAITLSYSFINQQSLGKSRQYFSVGIQIAFALGEALIGIVFYFIRDWRTVTYLLLIPTILLNVLLSFLQETPKFMISKDTELTLAIFNRIAKVNNKEALTLEDVLEAQEEEEQQQKQQNGSSVLDLFRYKSLRAISLATAAVFFGLQMIYYSTIFNLGTIGLSIYVNQLIVGISEAFGYVLAEFLIPKVPRKKMSFVGMGVSSLLCIILSFINGKQSYIIIISIIFLVILRFLLCMFWAIFYVYLAQLFPTRVRSLAFGWCSAVGTIGSAISPYLVLITSYLHMNSWMASGIIGALSTVCIFPLKQTLNAGLQEEIEELKLI